MTENEAIKTLTDKHTSIGTTKCDGVTWRKLKPAIDLAVNALEKVQQYQAIGTVEECRIASEKQVAKRITHDSTLLKCCTCPSCKNVLDKFETFGDSRLRVRFKFCHFCGQKLDWSDVE